MATPIFSNQPKFNQKPITVAGLLNMEKFDVITEADPQNNSVAQWLGTDSKESALWIKNVVHQLIHIGGKAIDFNFYFDMFYNQEHMVDTYQLFNHYIQDPDLNIYAAATRTGTGTCTFQLLKQNHLQGGTYSYPGEGYILFDKDSMKYYYISDVNTDTPYAHKVTVTSTVSDTEEITIDANVPYLILPANLVGGYSCPNVQNDAMSLGYTQQVNFFRLRKDWQVSLEILRSTIDKAQYAYIYDRDGNPYDAYDLYEQKMAREDLRMSFNVLAFIGSPITNSTLITAAVDPQHPGCYGLVPSIQFGGGILKPFAASVGWDWESDGEPIFLYQDSLKRTTEFMAVAGEQLLVNMDYRSNKMVARQLVGSTVFEAYRRASLTNTGDGSDAGTLSYLEKIGVKGYDYRGFKVDIKKWDSLSDARFVGSNQWSNSMIWMPGSGCTEGGKEVSPIEFYQYGKNGWTGDYEEIYVDERYTTRCESLAGYCAQSMAWKIHCPQLMVFAQGVADA